MNKFPKKTLEDWRALAVKECKGKPVEAALDLLKFMITGLILRVIGVSCG